MSHCCRKKSAKIRPRLGGFEIDIGNEMASYAYLSILGAFYLIVRKISKTKERRKKIKKIFPTRYDLGRIDLYEYVCTSSLTPQQKHKHGIVFRCNELSPQKILCYVTSYLVCERFAIRRSWFNDTHLFVKNEPFL